ncbi:hypothetical protein ACP4OV_019651 [Aristida adscensionis]
MLPIRLKGAILAVRPDRCLELKDAGNTAASTVQVPGIQGLQYPYAHQASVTPGFQNQYVSNAPCTPKFQNQYVNQAPAYQHNSANYNQPALSNKADLQKSLHIYGPSSNVSSVNLFSENSQTTCQDSVTSNAHGVNKVQIPTEPRIAPGLPAGILKGDKSNLEADLPTKPAYVSISIPKNDVKAVKGGSEAVIQATGSFPVSLRTYVERNLARCKDDAQRTASRSAFKEIITKATSDGTLHSKNWDIEPLFPLPETAASTNMTRAEKDSSPFSISSSRNPSRCVKSRWEPVAEEKAANNVELVAKESAKSNICSSLEAVNRTVNSWDLRKFIQSHQAPSSQCIQRPTKKQRNVGDASLTENGNALGDSDKEQDLTKHYASSTVLANSPEEKKRREHTSKRFERSQDESSKSRSSAQDKDVTANIYARRAISLLLNRRNGNGAGLAVEDLDWDALTIKGTRQEIEKQYLRLTSAPDPATVRPENVLEKALHMVETSHKNYLYKCDQTEVYSARPYCSEDSERADCQDVYETHARLAIQSGDLPEYNQCQSQLKRLYGEGVKGCHLEFSAMHHASL